MNDAKKTLVRLRSLNQGRVRLTLSVKISTDVARQVEAVLAMGAARAQSRNFMDQRQEPPKLLH
jgi:hypothetical protein